jgi:hypothetical protein
MFLTHGHIIVVFFLVSKYQAQTDEGKKTKMMMIGMVFVFAWMFGTPYLKEQRFSIAYKGTKVYESDQLVED